MRWSNEDTKLLQEWGYPQDDIVQIKRARKFVMLELSNKEVEDKKISIDKAIEILGREDFLSGLSRASFHWTSVRENDKGDSVYFDCSKMFEGF